MAMFCTTPESTCGSVRALGTKSPANTAVIHTVFSSRMGSTERTSFTEFCSGNKALSGLLPAKRASSPFSRLSKDHRHFREGAEGGRVGLFVLHRIDYQ